MRRSPLAAAILSGSLALQLLLAGGGTTCIDPAHASGAEPAGAQQHSMAGMDMAMDMSDHRMASHPEDAPAGGDAPCEEPATQTDCQVLAPCAGGFFASTPDRLDASGRLPSTVAARLAVALASRTIAPELPPPRA